MALAITATLAFRPVGAFFFGLLADRYGRRLPLMIDLVFYSVMEVLSGLAPNYTVFLLLRALFGIGMGGEWGVGASLAMEKVPARLRGLLSGFLQQGYAMGNLLAAVCYFFFSPRLGWRPLFFLGGLPALLALFVFTRVKESEVWKKTRHESWGQLGRAILSNWKMFLYMAVLMTAMNLARTARRTCTRLSWSANGISTCAERAGVDGVLHGGRDHGRDALRTSLGPDRPAPLHGDGAAGGGAGDSAVGLLAIGDTAGGRARL